jgi:dCTP diphosphatase
MDGSDKTEQEIQANDVFTLVEARETLRAFVKERDWQQFHTPRNLVMALVGEVGEVAEIFQWKGEVEAGLPSFTAE